jgi:hypothetical protein
VLVLILSQQQQQQYNKTIDYDKTANKRMRLGRRKCNHLIIHKIAQLEQTKAAIKYLK